MTIEELAARVFAARDVAHRAHWRTGSYSAHMALGEFYADVIKAIDDLIECYQGQFGLIGAFDVSTQGVPNLVGYLTSEADEIAASRDEITRGSDAVANLLDALVHVYRRAVYKLANLN